MIPLTLKDLLSVFVDGEHIIIDYWNSIYPIEADVPFSDHVVSSSQVEFTIDDDGMRFPAWMLNSYVQSVCIDPDRSLRIYLYGIK